jgi:hypothetical protein
LMASGQVRQVEQYLVVRAKSVAELATRCRTVEQLMERAGVPVTRLRERALEAAVAGQWRPGRRAHWVVYAPGWSLVYDEGLGARVTPERTTQRHGAGTRPSDAGTGGSTDGSAGRPGGGADGRDGSLRLPGGPDA